MIAEAIVFDLDNTLYPERRFALGGYVAVARHLESVHGVDAARAFRLMARALGAGRRAVVFADLAAELGLDESLIPTWVPIYRSHQPRLRLPAVTTRVLAQVGVRRRLGVLTNGLPFVQRSKVRALGLHRLVDEIVYAEEFGLANGKPHPRVFLDILRRLGCRPERSVFVGDDPVADIAGARGVGMRAVLTTNWRRAAASDVGQADAVIGSLEELPGLLGTWAREADHAA